jgi:hypothetical protein
MRKKMPIACRSLLVCVLVLVPAIAAAGEIYGRISEGGKPVGEGVSVELRCGGTAYPARATDKSGTYHLTAEKEGKCTLTVHYKGQSPSIEVVSFEDAVQVDLTIEAKDGKLALRRG